MRVPAGDSYPAWLDHHAATTPEHEAWVFGADRRSYAGLRADVERAAQALAAMGVARGDRVAQMGAPNPQYWTVLLATLRLGAIWVGLNARYTLAEIEHIVADSRPTVLILPDRIGTRSLDGERAALTSSMPELRIVAPDALLSADARTTHFRLPATDDGALIVYTSGTTGKPKGALLSHRAITGFCRGQSERIGVARPRVVGFFPINHVSATLDWCGTTLAAGGTILFMEQFDPQASVAMMARERANIWGGMPSTLAMQLDAPGFADHDLSAVEVILWGGAALPIDLIARLQRTCPRLATNYGLSETASAVTVLAPSDDPQLLAQSVGTPLDGVALRIADPGTDAPLPRGEEGEIQARSQLNMLRYWNNPPATGNAFTADGFLKTGDIGRLASDGHLEIRGRIREMFKSGGYNVYPREVELVLEAVPGVQNAAVVGVPDQIWQESGVAFVVADGDLRPALVEACTTALARYKHPKRFVLLSAMPLLPNGKVDRAQLARMARGTGTPLGDATKA